MHSDSTWLQFTYTHEGMGVCTHLCTHTRKLLSAKDLRLGNYFPGSQALLPTRCTILYKVLKALCLSAAFFKRGEKAYCALS